MKRLLGFILLASAVPALFSCTKESNFTPKPEMNEVVITATREADSPDTKTEMVDGKTYWSVGDKISVFFGSGTAGGAEFSSTNTEPVASADFSGILNAVTGSEEGGTVSQKYFWGVYPYSDQNSLTLSGSSNILTTVVNDFQYGVADSYSAGQNIWIGRSLGLELSFKSLLSGIKFTFSRNDITMVVIKGNNNEPLAGEVKVTMASGVPVVSSVVTGKTSITLTPEGRDTFLSGPVYRALFLPTNFTNGLTVTFFAADGSVGKRTYGNLDFLRNEPKAANNADSKATFVTPEPVDMGNGLLMAPWNVGATSPEEYGDWFAWGETSSKTDYSWDTYKWGRNASELIRYVTDASYGAPDYRMFLTDADDAATKNWGPSWRTPTDKEWQTLLDTGKYTWNWDPNYDGLGVRGYVVTSKSTGKSIFLPASGMKSYSGWSNLQHGNYWSSVGSENNANAKLLHFTSSSRGIQETGINYHRMKGLSVRPIYAPRKPVESIVMTGEEGDFVDNGKPKSVWALLQPADAFDRGLHIYTIDPSVVEVDASLHNFVIVDPEEGGIIPLTLHGPGTTEMIFETPDRSIRQTMIINVESTVTGITLNKTSHTFSGYPENLTPLQLTATVTPSTASQIVYWSSSNESVATVDSDGKVTPVSNGTATISAKKGSVTATCRVTVDIWQHVTGISFLDDPVMLPQGISKYLNPAITPANAHDTDIWWEISDNSIVSFDASTKKVTALKPGIAEITVHTEDLDFSAKYIVTVVTAFSGNYAYVDMGNGFKIAAKNLGAQNAWDPGDFFAWGETSRRTDSSIPWAYYRFYGGILDNAILMSKYNEVDGLTELNHILDDAATANWGINWRTMSLEDNHKLHSCNVTYDVSVNGVLGAMFESRINGAKIFIPYSHRMGKIGGGIYPYYANYNVYDVDRAYLWTREKVPSSNVELSLKAYTSIINKSYTNTYLAEDRRNLLCIRPVYVGN